MSEVVVAVEFIATTFQEPLKALGVSLLVHQGEITEVVEYAHNCLSLEREKSVTRCGTS